MTIVKAYGIMGIKKVLEVLLYRGGESNIHIYRMEPKEEELKKYRKKLLKKHEPIFYDLKTNSEDTIKGLFNRDEIDIRSINYNSSSQWSTIEKNDKSNIREEELKPYDYEQRKVQKNMMKRYINGEYSTLEPTRVYEFIYEDDLDCTVYKFLKPNCARNINKEQNIWQIENMMDLPKKLYLLQLLQLGDFEKLISEDIKEQFQLFDINYWETMRKNKISEMIETGLFSESFDDIMKKVEKSSKVLQKVWGQ